MTIEGLNLDTPAAYRIHVKGYLDSSWTDRLGGLTISPTSQGDGCVVTTLSGQLLDQAALFGVLIALYDMRLPLVYVEFLGDKYGHKMPLESTALNSRRKK